MYIYIYIYIHTHVICAKAHRRTQKRFEDNGVLHAPGTIMWARFHSWYPAKVYELDEVPTLYKNLIPDHPSDNVYVWRFEPFGDIKVAKVKRTALTKIVLLRLKTLTQHTIWLLSL